MYGNGYCGSAFGMGHGPWMLIFLLLALVTLVVFLSSGRKLRLENGGHRGDAALELLRRRYAAGEVSEEEFLVMKKNLQA